MEMTSLSLLCSQMMNRGYEYACFLPKEITSIEIPTSNMSLKPDKGIFFSKLHEVCDSEDIVPEWYTFLEYEMTDKFEKDCRRNIMFAKFHEILLMDFEECPYLNIFEKAVYNISMYDWSQIAKMFSGVIAKPVSKRNPYIGWDVNTVCVWKKDGIQKDAILFENNGPYTYDLGSEMKIHFQ